jgi:hypothetical protein
MLMFAVRIYFRELSGSIMGGICMHYTDYPPFFLSDLEAGQFCVWNMAFLFPRGTNDACCLMTITSSETARKNCSIDGYSQNLPIS